MSDAKIAGAPAPHAEPTPAAEAPPAPQSASEVPAPQLAAPAPAAPTPEPVQLSLADAVKAVPPPAPPTEPVDEIGALRAELAAELERTKAAREAVEAISDRSSERNRLSYLRQMGAMPALSDEHLMALAPQVDPDTSDGAAALQAWRESNDALFTTQHGGSTVSAKLVDSLRTSAHGTFGADFHRAQMRATFGGE